MCPMETHVILERVVKSKKDMLEVEEAITSQLGGEYNRCSFLRSNSYIRLRVAALYPSYFGNAHSAFCGNLSVTLVHTDSGPLVTLRWLDKVTYFQDIDMKRKCKKRARPVGEA